MVARLAIARSLAVSSEPEVLSSEERGKVIKGLNLFGEDLRIWLALLLEHRHSDDMAMDQIQDLIARHWARGLRLLENDWQTAGEDFDKFVISLAEQAGVSAEGGAATRSPAHAAGGFSPRASPVVVSIGEKSLDQDTNKRVDWVLNGPGVSPHVAVMGMAGTGKTRVARAMLRDLRTQSGAPVMLFDMGKGDLASDRELVESLGARVVDPLAGPIPLDVLHARADDLKKASMRFRESFKRVPKSRIGDAQGDILREAAERAYAGPHPVKLSDIYEKLRQLYAEKRRKEDSVIATFKDMTTWDLFQPAMEPAAFFGQSWVIDLHRAPETIKRLVVFLLFDAAYAHLSHLDDSPVDAAGNRALRLCLAVDEARLVLGFEHQSLISLVRESRSKGGTVMFISQSPDDFDTKSENFLENIGLTICFRTNARSAALNAAFGGPVDTSGLDNGVCVTRLVNRGLVRVRAWD
jgi:hypothetical protein